MPTTTHSSSSTNELLAKGPEECLRFIRDHFPSKFDWLRLADGAATKATHHITLGETPLEMGLSWIRIAVELYERMADHLTIDQKSRIRLTESAIAKRVQAIEIWGEKDDDSVLNLNELTIRFKSIIKISPAELRADADFPRSSGVRTALLVTQFIEPLLKIDSLRMRLPEIVEYCNAARIARENARTRTIGMK